MSAPSSNVGTARAGEHEAGLCARLDAVVRSARAAPAWAEILAGVGEAPFASRADFAHRVPIVDKQSLFGRFGDRPETLIRGGDFASVRGLLSSSGTAGDLLSFGFAGAGDLSRRAAAVDAALETLFAVSRHRTLLIAALPGSLHLSSNAVLVVETGPRADLVALFVERFAPRFDQIVLVCESPFVKQAVEAASRRVSLASLRIHVVVGGDYLYEGLRSYLGALLGIDVDDKEPRVQFLSILSMGEVGLNLLAEIPATVRLRRQLARRPDLIERLTGIALPTPPLLLVHDPERLMVEEHDGSIVVTHLDPDRLQPLVRYCTHDRGGIVPASRLASAAAACGETELAGADLAWMYGRQRQSIDVGARSIFVPEVGEALLSSVGTAPYLTGGFHLAKGAGGVLDVAVQMGPDLPAEAGEADRLRRLLTVELESRLAVPVRVETFAFERYPWAPLSPWETKFRYL